MKQMSPGQDLQRAQSVLCSGLDKAQNLRSGTLLVAAIVPSSPQ